MVPQNCTGSFLVHSHVLFNKNMQRATPRTDTYRSLLCCSYNVALGMINTPQLKCGCRLYLSHENSIAGRILGKYNAGVLSCNVFEMFLDHKNLDCKTYRKKSVEGTRLFPSNVIAYKT